MSTGLDLQPVAVSPDRVLVLATDPLLVEQVRLALPSEQFAVREASDIETAGTLLNIWQPHLAIVDFDVDQGTFLDWLIAAPALAGSTPAIAMSRSTELATRVAALDRGADDVLGVPCAPQELAARVVALIRRARRTSTMPVLRAGELEVDLVRRRATLNGIDLGLTPVEQSLLYLLASNAGRVLSRDAILNGLWGPDYASDSNIVDRHIRNLRIKLRDDWRHPRFIGTVAGLGYRFIPANDCPPQSLQTLAWTLRQRSSERPVGIGQRWR
jgi:DNA-binding response OmpR family regulator